MKDGMTGMVRLEFAQDPQMLRSEAVQLVATAKELEELVLAPRHFIDNLGFDATTGQPMGELI